MSEEENKKLYTKNGKITTLCGDGCKCPWVDENDPNKVIMHNDLGEIFHLTGPQWQAMKQYAIDSADYTETI